MSISTMTDLMTELKRSEKEGHLVFLSATAQWCHSSQLLQPSYQAMLKHWRHIGVSINAIEFDIDQARQISTYFNVEQAPSFICLLPKPHATLTKKELRWRGSDSVGLAHWMNTIMQKWLSCNKIK